MFEALSVSMNRVCPNCKQQSISVYRLMVVRVRCNNCKENIGHHWLYSTVMVCIESVVVVFLGLYLLGSSYPLVATIAIFISALFILTFVSSLFCPLEQKQNLLEP